MWHCNSLTWQYQNELFFEKGEQLLFTNTCKGEGERVSKPETKTFSADTISGTVSLWGSDRLPDYLSPIWTIFVNLHGWIILTVVSLLRINLSKSSCCRAEPTCRTWWCFVLRRFLLQISSLKPAWPVPPGQHSSHGSGRRQSWRPWPPTSANAPPPARQGKPQREREIKT